MARGTIVGSSYGVKLSGADGTVVNYGLMLAAGEGGVGVSANHGVVFNYFSINGNSGGVMMSGGGDVKNGAGAAIYGATGVGIDGGGTAVSAVINDGQITGTQYGVSLSNGYAPSTFGLGFELNTLTSVINDGTISETGSGLGDAGVLLSGDGAIFNGESINGGGTITIGNTAALIYGVTYGVVANDGTAVVFNAATIIGSVGSGVLLQSAGGVESAGTILGGLTGVTADGGANSSVDNVYLSTIGIHPLISGSNDGVLITGTHATMANIGGTVVGYSANEGSPSGTGVSLGSGGSVLNFSSGSNFAVISGADYGIHVSGLDGYGFNIGYVAATNSGGTGIAFDNGGYLSNSSIGTIQGGSIGIAVGVHTTGTQLAAGVLVNDGVVTGGQFGVSMAGYGIVNNTTSGYIRGDQIGVYIAGANASVSNFGTITTVTFSQPNIVPEFGPLIDPVQSTAVSFANGGAVFNGAGGYIYGTDNGVVINGGVPSTVVNDGGYIKGGTNGVILNGNNDYLYNSGGIYGAALGVVLENGGTVFNSGTILAPADSNTFQATGVSLSQGGYITNTASGLIYGYAHGVNVFGAAATIVNDGTISAPGVYFNTLAFGYSGIGVYSAKGGTLTNGSLGVISAYGIGVEAYGTMGITNFGSIIGRNDYGVSIDTGSITNYGLISGAVTGAYVNSGSIINAAGGTIIGARNGIVMEYDSGDKVYNAGTIIGFGGYGGTGVYMYAGGTVTNTGLINGTAYGVYVSAGAGTVINSGTISQTGLNGYRYASVYLNAGGTVVNMAGGTLSGYGTGVMVSNAAGTIINAGLINAIGYDGVSLNHGGSVVNMAGGTIIGGHIGVYTGYAGASVANYGLIEGNGSDGVSLYKGGSLFNAGVITGFYAGVYIAGAGSQVMNEGEISSATYGVLANGGSIVNSASAGIYGASMGVLGIVDPVNVENLGFIVGDFGAGISLAAGGNVVNYEGATIAGAYQGVQLASAGTVINAGSIVAFQSGVATIAGVSLLDGGYVHNYAPGYIRGYGAGVYLGGGGTVALRNDGTIYGYQTGVLLSDGGTVMNSGTIVSSNIGVTGLGGPTELFNSGSIDGADQIGVDITSGGNVVNDDGGYIYGQYDGVRLASAGTVLNGGSITTETGPEGPGIYTGVLLQNGGYVHNYGSGAIYGYTTGVYLGGGTVALRNDGVIRGSQDGVSMPGGGYILNTGLITANGDGVFAGAGSSVVNTGTIIGTFAIGVYLAGGTLTNAQNAVIYNGAGAGVVALGTSVVDNSGSIITANNGGPGVYDAAGSVINRQSGLITGGLGVSMGGGTLLNAGQISGSNGGVSGAPVLVTNYGSGTIEGASYGVALASSYATLLNAGSIIGADSFGVTFENSGTVDNYAGGVISGASFGLGAHGTVTVLNSGVINGADGFGIGINYGTVVNTQYATISGSDVGVSSGYADVTNAGLITGGYAGVDGYQMSVTNLATGHIAGANGVVIYGGLADVTNAGIMIGQSFAGVALLNGGTVTNLASGGIYGYDDGVSASSFASIDNSGVISAGAYDGITLGGGGAVVNRVGAHIYGHRAGVYAGNDAAVVTNAGSIGGYDNAVVLDAGGSVYNMTGASLSSYGDAVLLNGPSATLVNQGQILSTGGDSDAVDFETSGTMQNSGLISGGGYGVLLDQAGVTLTNYQGGHIEGGYTGVNADYATIINAGSITGGTDGLVMYGGILNNLDGGVIQGGARGLYAEYGAVVTNAGLILDDSQAGAVLGDNVTLTNQPGGTIAGVHGVDFDGNNATVFNAGTIASTEDGGFAVAFQNTGVNYLTLSTGSVLDGIIDGGGTDSQIDLVGAGTLGNTIQNFGTAGALTVETGADWTGTGSWAIGTVTNNGTFQGGRLNVPLNLTGDFIQASLATLKVVVTPTLSTQFIITGAAQLAGNLTYIFAPGYYSPHTYDFLTASDGTTGDFATVTYGGLVPPTLTHTTNTAPPGSNLVLAGNGIVTPADDGVFNAQSQAMADSAQQASTSLLGKASQGAGAGSSATQACAAEAGAAQNTATNNATTASRMATAVAAAFCGAGGWIEATGTEMNADASGGADDYHADTGGFLAGIDKAVNNAGTRVGLAVGYDETWLHDGGGGKADVNTVRVGLYASQPVGRFTIAADIMYGHGDNTTHRATGVGEANGSYGTNIYSGAVQGSTELSLGPVELVPAAGLRVAHISSGGFAETGGGFVPAFAVSGSGTGYTSVQPFVNLGFGHSFISANGMTITPSAGAGFIYEAGDRGKAVDVTAGDFTDFTSTHNNLDRATAVLSAGIAAGRNNWSLFAHYTAYVSGNWTSQTAEAGLQVKF